MHRESTPLNEPILSNEDIVYHGCEYIVDGKPIASPVQGTVADLKLCLGADEVRRNYYSAASGWIG